MNGEDTKTLIRSRTDIVDIIGERIPLEKKGKNFFGVCPFHDDSSPSLCVSREKQIYTCFSCHATGNVFSFMMDYEKMNFAEALHYLGEKVGVEVGKIKIKKENKELQKYYDIYDFSVKYFQNNLKAEVGEKARDYLQKRRIDDAVIKEFQIGLSLRKLDDLTKILTAKKYDLVDLNKIGLSSENHDIYNDRIMFPLYDILGKVVGFSGRIYSEGKENKYVNTKETVIFKKGECLYHYHIAKEEARIKKSIIIMEGFMDIIRASTIGIRNTIALMGTALTKEQIKLIKRISKNIILCLDGDEAGKKAAYNIGNTFKEEDIEVKIVTLPNEEDPDSFILKEGKDAFISYIENALNFNDYKIKIMKEKVNFNSIEETTNYINRVINEISTLDDEIRTEIILKRLAKDFNIGYNTLEKKFLNKKNEMDIQKQTQQKIIKKVEVVQKNKYQKALEQIIYFMLNNDWVINEVKKENLLVTDEIERTLIHEISYYYEMTGKISIADMITYLSEKEKLLNSLKNIISNDYMDQVEKETLYLYFKVIKEENLKKQIKVLERKLKNELDPIKQAKIGNEIRALRIGDNKNGSRNYDI